jgi:hypothetical protein
MRQPCWGCSPSAPSARSWVLDHETIDAAQRRFLYAPHFHNRTMHG